MMKPTNLRAKATAVICLLFILFASQRVSAQTATVLSDTYTLSDVHYACMDHLDCVEIRADAPASAVGDPADYTYNWYGQSTGSLWFETGVNTRMFCDPLNDLISCDITDSLGTVYTTNAVHVYVDHTAFLGDTAYSVTVGLDDTVRIAIPTFGISFSFSYVWSSLLDAGFNTFASNSTHLNDTIFYNIPLAELPQWSPYSLQISNEACNPPFYSYAIPVDVTIDSTPAGPDQTLSCASLPGGTVTMDANGTGTWTARSGNPGTATIVSPASPTTAITTFSAAGVYGFVLTSAGGQKDTALVTVTAKPNAGADQSATFGGTATMAATGTGTWTALPSNQGSATITSASSPTTTITSFSLAGGYGFIWTNSSGCTDTALVIVSSAISAGPDRSLSCISVPGGSVTMAGTGTGTWTARGGNPGTATIVSATSPTTIINTFSTAGIYGFIYTNAGGQKDTALVTVTTKPNAGTDKTVSCAYLTGGSATMSATGTGTWSAIAGNPGTATINSATSPTTTITNYSTAGAYYFKWTNSSGCADTALITVTAKPNAGADRSAIVGGSATMAATGTGTWTAQSGNPGTATITTTTLPTSTITGFSLAGTYSFIWTNSAGCKDTAAVIVGTTIPDAGPDQLWCQSTTGYMHATGTGHWSAFSTNPYPAYWDDASSPTTAVRYMEYVGTYGFIWTTASGPDTMYIVARAKPNAGQEYLYVCTFDTVVTTIGATGPAVWRYISGPGPAIITDSTAASTTIRFHPPILGSYFFAYTNSYGCFDSLVVNAYTCAPAGPDRSICAPIPGGSVTMGAGGTGTWSAVAGNPGTATITTPSASNTTITSFSAAGTYKFAWNYGTGSDTALVSVYLKPNAGTDRTATLGGSATMGASGTGSWYAPAGNPGTVVITTSSSATTTITGFTAAGTYILLWYGSSGCTDTALVVVSSAVASAGPDRFVSCNSQGSATMSATGTGTWTAVSSNPGSATITSPTSPTTTITSFSSAGTYAFAWTLSGGQSDTALVTVTFPPNAGLDRQCSSPSFPGGYTAMSAYGAGTWSAISGNPGAATIIAPTSPTTAITNYSAAGTYRFLWTNASGCYDTALVIVTQGTCTFTVTDTVTYPNCTVNSGSVRIGVTGGTAPFQYRKGINGTWQSSNAFTGLNGERDTFYIKDASTCIQTITEYITPAVSMPYVSVSSNSPVALGGTIQLNCTVAGIGGITSYSWTGIGGFTSTVANPSIPNATASNSGYYQLRVTDGQGCIGYDSKTVTVGGNAGPDQAICLGTSTTMAAQGSGSWSIVFAPGTVSLGSSSDPLTTVVLGSNGTYTFVWTVAGQRDTMLIVVNVWANAGVDQTATTGGSATMAATGTGTWTAVPGNPATAIITSPSSPTTTITSLSTAGTYSFVWTNSSDCKDTAQIIVSAATFSAGPDRTVTCATLTGGTVTMGGVGTGTWSAMTGNPGTATIAVTTSATTTISNFTTAGVYSFIYTSSGGQRDTALVTVTARPNAGADKTVSCATLPGGSATMAATGTGTWTAIAGNPGTATITSATSPATTITNYTAAGIYSFRWTNSSGCADTAIVTVTARPDAGVDKTAAISGSVNMSATGSGTWTAQSGNAGTATIASPTSPTTAISGFSAAGAYRYIWTNAAGCTDTALITVTATGCSLTLTDSTHSPTCTGGANGQVIIYATGGTAPYMYKTGANWQSSNVFTSVAIGTATYDVQDAAGCTASINATVAARVSGVRKMSYIPMGNRTYLFTANDFGYDNPVYWWAYDVGNFLSGSQKTITHTFSTAGQHSMWVTVNEGAIGTCSVPDSIAFTIPSSCSLSDSVTYTYLGGTQFRFISHTTGATRPGYFWFVPSTWTRISGSGGTAVYSIPTAGVYSMSLTTVDSATGCGFTSTINVNSSPLCTLVMYDTITHPSCALASGSVRITAAAGTAPYQYRMGINGTWQSSSVFTGLTAGIDTFYTIDAGGCTVSHRDTLVRPTTYPTVTPTSNSPVPVGGTITLTGTSTGASRYSWTGPNTFSATTQNASIPNAAGGNTGVYTFTGSNSFGCSVSANITVIVGNGGAGPDRTLSCVALPGGTATMAAIGSGTWSALTGNPGSATITTPTDPATTITGFTAAGVYSFLYTQGAQLDTATVTVTTAPNAGPDRSLSCVPLSGGTATMAATGTGTWTIRSGNPGTSRITTATSPTTTITTFSAPGTYYYIWTNAGGCKDTATVTVTSIPAAPVLYATGGCPGFDTLTVNAVSGSSQITWLLNGGIVHTSASTDTVYVPLAAGSYTATITTGLCQSQASNASTLLSCLSDSVWPGDADHNGLADNRDLLKIGVGYGLNGFPRVDQSIVWSAHYSQDWGVQFVDGNNVKHADCNGDGVINANDTVAIMQNFGLTHSKTDGSGAPWRNALPAIRMLYSKDTLTSGDTLITSLLFGDSITPVTDFYGFGFTFNYDPLVVDTTSLAFDFISSFIGNSTDAISISKSFSNGTVKAAIVRINHTNRDGYGIIAKFRSIITTDNINGKDLAYYSNINYITDIYAIDKDENILSINAGTDSMHVSYEPTGIRDISTEHLSLYPNPASQQVTITAENAIQQVTITDMLGQQVLTEAGRGARAEVIDISHLASGVYSVRIATSRGSGTARLTITR